MARTDRPRITHIGRVMTCAGQTVMSGWTINPCMAECSCHRDPRTGGLAIYQNDWEGSLGLAKYRPCDCCSPWTAAELTSIVDDLRYITNPLTPGSPA